MKQLLLTILLPALLMGMQDQDKSKADEPQPAAKQAVPVTAVPVANYALDLSAGDNFFIAYMLATPARREYAKTVLFQDPEYLKQVNKNH
ncbi:hypothetical protein BH09DEP1_BH09DEP1_8130 [soil metagenome]